MKKLSVVLALVNSLMAAFASFALASESIPPISNKEWTVVESSIKHVYEVTIPVSIDDPRVMPDNYGEQFIMNCDGVDRHYTDTKFYVPKKIVGLTQFNSDDVSLTYKTKLGYATDHYVESDPVSKIVYVDFAEQFCWEEYTYNGDGTCTPGNGWVCGDVYFTRSGNVRINVQAAQLSVIRTK